MTQTAARVTQINSLSQAIHDMSTAGTWQAMPQMSHLLQSKDGLTNSGVSVVLPVNDMGPASATPEDFVVSAKSACNAVVAFEDADIQPLIAQPAVLPTSAALGSLNTAILQSMPDTVGKVQHVSTANHWTRYVISHRY